MYRFLYLSWPRTILVSLVLPVLTASFFVYSRPFENYAVEGAALSYARLSHLAPLGIPAQLSPSRLVSADGTLLATFTDQYRVPVPLKEVSPWVVKALISQEDRTFYANQGTDARSIIRAALNNLLGRPVQGASTITEQYVKNLIELNTGRPAPDTITRKLDEVVYARELTLLLSKSAILQGYLNTVYFGDGAYGIGAAAHSYFSRAAAKLSLPESALLVALVRSPSYYDPLANPKAAKSERDLVLLSMRENHQISSHQYHSAVSAPLGLRPAAPPSSGCASSSVPYFCMLAWSQLLDMPLLGPDQAARASELYSGGLTITSTLIPSYQHSLEQAAVSKVGYKSPIGAALVSVTPGTGAIVAMAQNRLYGLDVKSNQTEVNYAASPSPVGSTMKAFTLATAFSKKIPATTILPAGPTYHSNIFQNPKVGYFTNADPYDPTNITIATATAYSVNTAFVQLEEKIGVLPIAHLAYTMGLRSLALTGPTAPRANEGSFTLGARSFSPLEMASAYATIASGGTYCVPSAISAVTFSSSTKIPVEPSCHHVVATSVADEVTTMLEGPVSYGTGTAAGVPGYPIAGKTGTTQNYGSAWFIGYTPQIVTASWMGNPLGPSHPLLSVDNVSPVYGGTLPAQMFNIAMTKILSTLSPLPLPGSLYSTLLTRPVLPPLNGLPGALAESRLAGLGVRVVGILPSVVTSQSPSAGTPLYPGMVVRLLGHT